MELRLLSEDSVPQSPTVQRALGRKTPGQMQPEPQETDEKKRNNPAKAAMPGGDTGAGDQEEREIKEVDSSLK